MNQLLFRYTKVTQPEGIGVFVEQFNLMFYHPNGNSLEYARESIRGMVGHDLFELEEYEGEDK